MALISAHILSENMSKSNSETCRGDFGVRNVTGKAGVLGAWSDSGTKARIETAQEIRDRSGEAQAAKVSVATKGKNPVQDGQTSAMKPVAWLERQVGGWGWEENRDGEDRGMLTLELRKSVI